VFKGSDEDGPPAPGAVVDAKLCLSLLEMAAYGLFAQLKKPGDLADTLAVRQMTQHGKLSRG
jgi:hypothetical protein